MSSNMTLSADLNNSTEVLQAGVVPDDAEKSYQVPISQEAINFMLIGMALSTNLILLNCFANRYMYMCIFFQVSWLFLLLALSLALFAAKMWVALKQNAVALKNL